MSTLLSLNPQNELNNQLYWQTILQATRKELPETVISQPRKKNMNIWVARNDESFSFIYAEHLDILQNMGMVSFFNPEEDQVIPADIDLLYLPGGYPEKHAEALMAAKDTCASIRQYVEQGGKTLAECGGMIYLSKGIVADEEKYYEMAGVLPFSISMRKQDRKLSLGYRQFESNGLSMRGHEFHYTQFVPQTDMPSSFVQVHDAHSRPVDTPVFKYKHLIASYTHLYWGDNDIMKLFQS